MKCIDCTHCNLRAEPRMSRLGFNACAVLKSNARSFAPEFERECNTFHPAVADVVTQRRIWLTSPSRGVQSGKSQI